MSDQTIWNRFHHYRLNVRHLLSRTPLKAVEHICGEQSDTHYVTCHTRDNKILDEFYASIKEAYK